MPVTAVIILAAGESLRMGAPKALLKIGDRSFVRHVAGVYTMSDVDNIVVVTRPDAPEIAKELHDLDVSITTNKDPEAGQLSSIITGLDAARPFGPKAAFVHPVDHPFVSPSLVNSLLEKFWSARCLIVLPTYHGKRGHPVLFSSKLFDELKKAPAEVGARSVVWAHADKVVEVPTRERGVILDVDTPKDYERLQGNLQSPPG